MRTYTVLFCRENTTPDDDGLPSVPDHPEWVAKVHVPFQRVYDELAKVDGQFLNLEARAAKVALPKVFGKGAHIEFERIGVSGAWGRVIGKDGEALSPLLEFGVRGGRI